jgi:hypothetical protein
MSPKLIQPFLWFSDLKKIDLQKNKTRVIMNVLNIGNKPATDWLFNFYPKAVIKKTIISYGAKGELSAKSLNYWTLILNIDQTKLVKSRL